MRPRITIRPGVPGDIDAVFRMIVDSAESHGAREAVCVDAAALLRDGFGDVPRFRLLVAEEAQGAVVGVAMYSFSYSTWISVNGLFLDELYVEPAWHRQGIARALLMQLARIACQEGCRRFQWLVLNSNAAAIGLYESIGADFEGFILMQLRGDDIDRLAFGSLDLR